MPQVLIRFWPMENNNFFVCVQRLIDFVIKQKHIL